MAEETTKRRSKDSVFVDLFQDKRYVAQLYNEFYPDDVAVTADDIEILTLHSVIVNTQYNDLGFLARGKFIVLIEAQSSWNPNMTLRMLFYLAETYRRYLADSCQSEHSGTRVQLPRPDLYVVYSGAGKKPRVISLNEDYFGGGAPVDLRVKVIDEIDETLCGQYIGFCQIFNEQRRLYSNSLQCAQETLRLCIEKGYLAVYLRSHEKEAVTMMSELFDEEYLRKQYDEAEREKNRKEGRAEGRAEGIFGTINVLRSLNIPNGDIAEKIAETFHLTPEAAQEYLATAR